MQLGNPKKVALVHKAVFELRYRYGFNYLDRCGRITNAIFREWPDEWILADVSPSPQNAPLVSTKNRCRFNFSALKLDFGVEQEMGEESLSPEDLEEFVRQIKELGQFVINELELTEFSRIGFRIWYLFASRDKMEAEEWLRGLRCFQVSSALTEGFKGKLESASAVFVIESNNRTFRVAFNNVERSVPLNLGSDILNIPAHALPKGQKEHLVRQLKLQKKITHNPDCAALIDVDAYLEEPQIVEPGKFVSESLGQIESFLESAVGQEGE